MKVTTNYNNFARGKLDHDLQGRFDLPIYYSGADVVKNFLTNFKGNAIYRSGFERILKHADCYMLKFNFSLEQNYILVFYNTKLRFLSYDSNGNFGWVLDGGMSILELTTPYSLADSKQLQFSRNADVMYITHPSHAPRKLIRTAANAFTLTTYDIVGNPFNQVVANITAITKANPAVVTATAHGLRNDDIVTIASVGGMTEVNGNTYVIRVIDANSFELRGVNSTAYTTYTSGGTATRAASYPACVLFYKGRLYYGRTPNKITTIWASAIADYDNLEIPSSVDDESPLQFTIADISQQIEWLFAGDNSLIVGSGNGIVAVNGGGVNVPITASSIEANLTTAEPCNAAYPITKDGLIFYVGADGRNIYYFQYDLLTESFVSNDSNVTSYDITDGGITRLMHLKDRNDIIIGLKDDGTCVTLNFRLSGNEQIIGWHLQTLAHSGYIHDIMRIRDNEGRPDWFILGEYDSEFFFERQGKYVEFAKRSDFLSTDQADDDEAYNRFVAEQLKDCVYMDAAQTLYYLNDNLITYDPNAGTITATSSVFTSNDVGRHIDYKTMTGYESGRFEITAYTSGTVVEVDVLQEPTSNTYQYWYLTFDSVSGLTDYEGETISIVADGGYLKDEVVDSGAVDIGRQVSQVWIGYRYLGSIKSFPMGFQMKEGVNTQTTQKAISRVGMRFTTSAGAFFGSSPYDLEAVQELSQNDLNYLPPLPMDGTKYITISDNLTLDKCFYIAQPLPLPLNVNAVMIEAAYGTLT